MDINYETELVKDGAIAFVPGGNSMWPTLKNRGQSVVVIKKEERLNLFDVAFYSREDGKFVLHRVIEVAEDGYITCGDSQFTQEAVKEEKVFGKMAGFYKGKRYVDCSDEKYLAKVKRWYKNEKRRKRKVKAFYFGERVKSKLKKIFGVKSETEKIK